MCSRVGCFHTCANVIKHHVSDKVERYQRNDAADPRFRRLSYKTINYVDAYQLLKNSAGKCSLCGINVELHNWENMSPTQLSFDRKNDNLPHTKENLAITCLQCNKNKAKQQYRPTATEEEFNQYERYRRELIQLEKTNYDVVYHAELRGFIAYLHNVVYGDRKNNSWIKPSLFVPTGIRIIPPTPR